MSGGMWSNRIFFFERYVILAVAIRLLLPDIISVGLSPGVVGEGHVMLQNCELDPLLRM